jgi:hypothetical protein
MHDTPKPAQPPVAPKRLVLHSFSDGGSGGGNIDLTILATSLGFVLVQLDVSIVNIALAKIGADLGTAVAGLQWIVRSIPLANCLRSQRSLDWLAPSFVPKAPGLPRSFGAP